MKDAELIDSLVRLLRLEGELNTALKRVVRQMGQHIAKEVSMGSVPSQIAAINKSMEEVTSLTEDGLRLYRVEVDRLGDVLLRVLPERPPTYTH